MVGRVRGRQGASLEEGGAVPARVGDRSVRLPVVRGGARRRGGRGERSGGAAVRGVARGARRHPDVPFAVRGRRQRARAAGRGQAQGGLADAQQGALGEADGTLAHAGAVQRRAVRGAGVGDRDPAVRSDRDGAVQAGDVRVVQGDVRPGGAAHVDLAAVQQMDPARVGTGDHMELGRDVVQVGARFGGRAQAEHGAVRQGWLTEGAALGVESLRARVQHDLAATGLSAPLALAGAPAPPTAEASPDATAASAVPAGAVTSTSQAAARPRGSEGGPNGSTTVSRICIAVRGPFRAGARDEDEAVLRSPTAEIPHRTRARRPVLEASSHLPLTTRPPPTRK